MNKQPSTVRAIQLARKLLTENAEQASTLHGVINEEYVAAIVKLISVAANVAVGNKPPRR